MKGSKNTESALKQTAFDIPQSINFLVIPAVMIGKDISRVWETINSTQTQKRSPVNMWDKIQGQHLQEVPNFFKVDGECHLMPKSIFCGFF